MKIAVLGAGMVGRTIATDLSTNFQVTSFDISEENLFTLQTKAPVQTVVANLADTSGYAVLLEGFDIIVSAVPGFMGYKTLETLINL